MSSTAKSSAVGRTDQEHELVHAAASALRLLQDRQRHVPEEMLDPRERRVLRQLGDALRAAVLNDAPRSEPAPDRIHLRLIVLPVVLAAGHPMTLRQVHYRLVSRDDVVHPNTMTAYGTLGGWLRDDRLEGLIPWEWMEDRLRVARGWAMWDDPARFLHSVRSNYARDPWQDQSHYVEVWCEKDALSGIFSDALSRYGVTLNIGRGYDGWSSIKRAADRYSWRQDEFGMDTTVLYFGDFDPSGEDMHRSLQERFAILGVYPEIPKVALTHDDARRLPGDVAKADDSRAAAFVAKYGNLAVELDALPVDELRSRIQQGVEERMDIEALAENDRIEREQRRQLRDGIDQIFGDNGLVI